MNLEMVSDYRDNDYLRTSFNELAGKVFGIDFERWYQLGFWDDRYICHSFAHHGRIIANVSVSKMDMILEGKRIKTAQIGTVMTHPDYRKKGLAENLMHTVLAEHEKKVDLFFLFANKDAVGFYPRFGFTPVKETRFYADLAYDCNSNGIDRNVRKLNISDHNDISIIKRLVSGRVPLSAAFSVEQGIGILGWHCLNVFPDDVYYMEAIDSIAIHHVQDRTLHLYDVICSGRPDYLKIAAALVTSGVDRILFYFTPDPGNIQIKTMQYDTEDYVFFCKSATVGLKGEFFYPYTAHA